LLGAANIVATAFCLSRKTAEANIFDNKQETKKNEKNTECSYSEKLEKTKIKQRFGGWCQYSTFFGSKSGVL